MKRISTSFKKPVLALILLALVALLLSCTETPAQTSAASTPTPVSSTTTASPNPATVPPSTTAEALPTGSATATAASTPPATITASPIVPDWTAPALSEAGLPADLSGIVQQILPSVVSINVEVSSTNLFGQSTTEQGAGSGWIIDAANGLIVTNAHVVEGAKSISVSLSDGRNFPAEKVVADPTTDLAVIKINATGLKAVKLGDSAKLKQGMMVIAIGNALGQGLSVTAGWVSRLNVSLTVSSSTTTTGATLFGLIEISAPINPGNSGGPLIDMNGEVVGITNAKLVATGVEAVGYAISTQSALPILKQLIQTGGVVRPYMGVSIEDVTPTIASIYGLAVNQGAIITQVDPSGPAAKAGLQVGDVIVGIGSATINSAADAIKAILTSSIGEKVTVTYYRGSTKSTAQVTLAQNPNP